VGTLNQALDLLIQKQKGWNERKSAVWGRSTGFPSLDAYTGGFERGKVFVLGARTSHGKTALATAMAFSVATECLIAGEPGQVLVFSPEMADYMIALRQVCALSGVSMTKVRRGEATQPELNAWFEAIEMMRLLDPYIVLVDQDEPNIQDMVRRIDIEAKTGKYPIALVVVDYLQYLTNGGSQNGSYELYSMIAHTMKHQAKKLDVPVLLLSQLNRDAAKKEEVPDLHDLEGSGKIEARADVVALLYRPNEIQDDPEAPQTAILAIRKNRDGATGFVNLYYYPALTKFVDPLSIGNTWQDVAPDSAVTTSKSALPEYGEDLFTGDETETWSSELEDSVFE
jgi:replicative DNA helicase